jgi:hypothetical protein
MSLRVAIFPVVYNLLSSVSYLFLDELSCVILQRPVALDHPSAALPCLNNRIPLSALAMRLSSRAGFGQWTRPRCQPQAWTCPGCAIKPPSSSRRTFTNHTRIQIGPRTRRRRALWAAGTATTAGLGGFFFQDDVKHVWQATERSSRVVSTLGICINEYV